MAEPVVFHLPGSVIRGTARIKPYYETLLTGLMERGLDVQTIPHDRPTTLETVMAIEGFHIADHGGLRHPRLLNTGIAYIYPFWNIDPWGIRALSSIGSQVFDPASVDPVKAGAFAGRLRKRLIGKRISRYEQPETVTDLPPQSIAVFLQSEGHRNVAETCHLDLRGMIGALLARADPAPILVKPHPRDKDPRTRDWLAGEAARDGRLRVIDANIHDLLAAAKVVVTINSAVGIEAMVHGKPVILCGQTDFHHSAVTVHNPSQMEPKIADALATDWPHDAFLSWYFEDRCLNAGKDSLVEDFLAKIAATGFDIAKIGA